MTNSPTTLRRSDPGARAGAGPGPATRARRRPCGPAGCGWGRARPAGRRAAASVALLGGSPAYAAYSVTPHANGTVSVSVNRAWGWPGPTPHCTGSAPGWWWSRSAPAAPPCRRCRTPPGRAPQERHDRVGRGADGHLSISVQIRGMPKGYIMLLAFSPRPGGQGGVGAGGLTTAPAPRCVSLTAPPPGGGSGAATGSGGGTASNAG